MNKNIKLHIGCGNRFLEGYTHIDIVNFPHVDYVHNAQTLPMLEDGSVNLIYSAHLLEHFFSYEVSKVLQEWRRVLEIGGTIRLAVPDFESLISVYRKYNDIDLIRGSLYGKSTRVQGYNEPSHKTVYDFASLKKLLNDTGFSNVHRWDWREVFTGKHAGFDDYSQAYIPHMDKDNGVLVSLNIEAIKT